MTPDTGFVEVAPDVRLAYQRYGNGEDTIVIPGASYLATDLDRLGDKFQLIFYDQRGRGASDGVGNPDMIWSDYEMDDLEKIRQHFDLAQMNLFAWSYNGLVAAIYTRMYPGRVRRLVQMCPAPPRSDASYIDYQAIEELANSRIHKEALDRLEVLRQEGLDQSDPIAYCRAYCRVYFPRQMGIPDALERMRNDPCQYKNEWPEQREQHRQQHFPDGSWDSDYREGLKEVHAPTLVIHGMGDLIPLAASKDWAGAFGDARLLVIEGAGHFLHLEAPEPIFSAVEQFFSGLWPESAVTVDGV